jgi:hypothetical protein
LGRSILGIGLGVCRYEQSDSDSQLRKQTNTLPLGVDWNNLFNFPLAGQRIVGNS